MFQEKKIYMTNEAIEVLINIGVQEPSDLKDLDDDDIESFRNAWHIGVGIAKDADFSRREKRREEYAEFCESL